MDPEALADLIHAHATQKAAGHSEPESFVVGYLTGQLEETLHHVPASFREKLASRFTPSPVVP